MCAVDIYLGDILPLGSHQNFTVMCLVTWPWIGSEAGSDLVVMQTSLLLKCNYKLFYSVRTCEHVKSSEVYIKTRSPGSSLPIQG